MAKEAQFFGAERGDVVDINHVAGTYPKSLRDELLRMVVAAGVLDGFRCVVPDQTGATKGQVDIYNGRAIDWGGRFLNDQTGTVSERVPLLAINTEFWIEVRLKFVDSDFDNRAFWDALVANTPPIPPGQEQNVARTATRKIPAWEVVQPIRQNAVGQRTDGGYTPARFSDSDELVIPVAVIRTNASGQILAGNPETDATGNDVVAVPFSGGTQNVIRPVGYGETSSVTVDAFTGVPWGRKSSDQRPRVGERLEFPFLFGGSGEVVGDADSDLWVRDWKSAYDALATQFARLMFGVDQGDIVNGVLDAIDPDFNWVDVRTLAVPHDNGTAINPNIHVDHFIGWTFQITSSGWSGFYAQVKGNDRKDGSNVVRLYLHRQSLPPEWWPLPDTSSPPAIRIVRGRAENWATKPLPSSGNRGVHALDEEVVNARSDRRSLILFSNLNDRLNAGKESEVTLTPDTSTAFRYGDVVVDASDLSSIQGAQDTISAQVLGSVNGKGGTIYFRKGTYALDELINAGTVFVNANAAESMTFKGDGPTQTVLNFGTSVGSAIDMTVFNLSACSDIEFRDLKIVGKGVVLQLSGCRNVRFKNCTFEGAFTDTNRGTVDIGDAQDFLFEGCTFGLAGQGVRMSAAKRGRFVRCTFYNLSGDPAELRYMLYSGSTMEQIQVVDCEFRGAVGYGALQVVSSFSRCTIRGCDLSQVTGPTTANGALSFRSGVLRSKIVENVIGTLSAVNGIPKGVDVSGSFTDSVFANNEVLLFNSGCDLGSPTRSRIHDNSLVGNGSVASSIGLQVTSALRSVIHHNTISFFELAIEAKGTLGGSIDGNAIESVVSGLLLAESGSPGDRPERVHVGGNSITGTGSTGSNYGILAFSARYCTFEANTFEDVGAGLSMFETVASACFGNAVVGNVAHSAIGAFFLEYVTESTIVGNNSYDNATGVAFALTNATSNTFHANRVTPAPAASVTAFAGLDRVTRANFGYGNVNSSLAAPDLSFYTFQEYTTVERDAIPGASLTAGQVIYNTTTNKHQGWNGATWNDMY